MSEIQAGLCGAGSHNRAPLCVMFYKALFTASITAQGYQSTWTYMLVGFSNELQVFLSSLGTMPLLSHSIDQGKSGDQNRFKQGKVGSTF